MRLSAPIAYLAGFSVLAALSAASLGLVALRVSWTGSPFLAFMSWNLLLAWVPLGFGAALVVLHRAGGPPWTLGIALAGWLLFLPNAPYLVTDLIHLEYGTRVPDWYDAVLLGSFAVTGILLGFASLYLAQGVLAERLGRVAAWMFTLAAITLSSVGIYMGRYLRLNSWDVFEDPRFFAEIARMRLADPLGNPTLIVVVAGFTVALTAGYLVVYAAARVALSAADARQRSLSQRR